MSPTFRLQSCTAVLIKSEAALTALNWNSSSPRDTLNSKCCSCPASRRCRSISAIAPTNVASSCVATIGSLGGIDHRKKAAGNATPAGHQDLILSVILLALESCECGKIHLDHVSQTRCILFFCSRAVQALSVFLWWPQRQYPARRIHGADTLIFEIYYILDFSTVFSTHYQYNL